MLVTLQQRVLFIGTIEFVQYNLLLRTNQLKAISHAPQINKTHRLTHVLTFILRICGLEYHVFYYALLSNDAWRSLHIRPIST